MLDLLFHYDLFGKKIEIVISIEMYLKYQIPSDFHMMC